eukprot:3013333-Prorocentrum_lima.AAC.1
MCSTPIQPAPIRPTPSTLVLLAMSPGGRRGASRQRSRGSSRCSERPAGRPRPRSSHQPTREVRDVH